MREKRKMEKLTMTALLDTIKKCAAPVGAAYLSRHLDASAATIGRMLKQAEEKGLIVSVSNKGRILTEKGEAFLESHNAKAELLQNAEEMIALVFSEDKKYALDVLRLRRLIEPYAVRLAAQNAADEDRNEIRDLAFEHHYVIRKGESGSEQDLRLHLKFAELSGNRAIFQVLRLLLTEHNVYQYFAAVSPKGEAGSYIDHEAILRAFYEKDGERAAAAMEQHIDNLIRVVEKTAR